MDIIKCVIRGQRLSVNVPVMADLTVNYFNIMANFDSTWERYPLRYVHIHSTEDSTVGGDWTLDSENKVADTEGINLTAGEWEIWFHGALVDDITLETVTRITTERKVIKVLPTGNEGGVMPVIPESNVEQITALAEEAVAIAQGVRDDADSGEFNGATFTPSVSSEGIISWTNDKDLPNPTSQNIKGPKGDTGTGIPSGGTIGQVIVKGSGDDVSWGEKQNVINVTGIPKGSGSGNFTTAVEGTDYAIPSQIPDGSDSDPIMDGTASSGSGTTWSRSDHVHPSDTSRVAKSGDTMTGNLALKNTYEDGVAPSSDTVGTRINITDTNNVVTGRIAAPAFNDGRQGVQLTSYRNGVANNLGLYINSDGERVVATNAVPAWQKTLGIDRKVNPNILDNWYFVGGNTTGAYGIFPVNQSGIGSYSDAGYVIDRWKTSDAMPVVLNDNYITLNNSSGSANIGFAQILPNSYSFWVGKNLTCAVLLSGNVLVTGTLTIPSDASGSSTYYNFTSTTSGILPRIVVRNASQVEFSVRVSSNTSVNVVAVKIEIGDTQTLAHNEGTGLNPVWVLNEIPNYEEQLIRCLTNQADSEDTYSNKITVVSNTKSELTPYAKTKKIFEIGAISEAFTISSTSGQNTQDISLSNNEKGFIVITGASDGCKEIVIYNASNTPTVSAAKVIGRTSIDVVTTNSPPKITITNNTSYQLSCLKTSW